MKSINCSQSDFNKTKKSFEGKKTMMNDANIANFRETLSVFSFNNNNSNIEKRNTSVNIKVKEKQEYEFPNIKTMKKELTQNIYTKESGEIISAVKQSNDNLRNTNNSSFKPEFATTLTNGGLNKCLKKDLISNEKFN